jgi:hypothetical protein
VNRLQKAGCLQPGWRSAWQWTCDGQQVASISQRAEADHVDLSYRIGIGGEWEEITETVRIVHVACRLGGDRPYFICPGVVNGIICGKRVSKLYQATRYFLCRGCNRLAYASQSEGDLDRALRRANKMRQRLGGEPGMLSPFPNRPRGMWRRTYGNLRREAFEAEMRAEEALGTFSARLLQRVEHPNRKRNFWS